MSSRRMSCKYSNTLESQASPLLLGGKSYDVEVGWLVRLGNTHACTCTDHVKMKIIINI